MVPHKAKKHSQFRWWEFYWQSFFLQIVCRVYLLKKFKNQSQFSNEMNDVIVLNAPRRIIAQYYSNKSKQTHVQHCREYHSRTLKTPNSSSEKIFGADIDNQNSK